MYLEPPEKTKQFTHAGLSNAIKLMQLTQTRVDTIKVRVFFLNSNASQITELTLKQFISLLSTDHDRIII